MGFMQFLGHRGAVQIFGTCFNIKIVYIVDTIVKINIIKNYADRIQINIRLVLFCNLINECDTHYHINLF